MKTTADTTIPVHQFMMKIWNVTSLFYAFIEYMSQDKNPLLVKGRFSQNNGLTKLSAYTFSVHPLTHWVAAHSPWQGKSSGVRQIKIIK
jgi:hypothetical protein